MTGDHIRNASVSCCQGVSHGRKNTTGMDDTTLDVAGDMLDEATEVVNAAVHLAAGGAIVDDSQLQERIEDICSRVNTRCLERDGAHVRCLDELEAEALADAAGLVVRASREHGRLWRMAGRVLSLASGAESPA